MKKKKTNNFFAVKKKIKCFTDYITEVTTVWFVQPPGKEPVYVVRVEIPPTETFTVPPGGKPFTPEVSICFTIRIICY